MRGGGGNNLRSFLLFPYKFKGDSGGPLVLHGEQVGIVSWSIKPCGQYPGVFTKVSHYRDWIYQITGV